MAEIYGNRWETIKSLGEGGQGHVFLVKDTINLSDATFVLKRLKNIGRVDRFKKEIDAVKGLGHDNIVRVIDSNLQGDKPYFVTFFYEGGNLKDARRRWKGKPVVAIQMFRTICSAMNQLHQKSNPVVHRDLKPENIFLKDKDHLDPVIGDFGVCYYENGHRITLIEEAVGPRLFMAPELEDGREENVSPKADVYSLGKLLYWMLNEEGALFSREKHRDPEWDLRVRIDAANGWDWKNIYFEHINRILDQMITTEPRSRAPLIQIIPQLDRAIKLIEREFTPITMDAGMPCEFCGQGYYKFVAKGNQVSNFGLNPIGNPDWRILTCDVCGHVQLFRIEEASQRDWWETK